MRITTKPLYSFDDVLLTPQFSTIKSRKDVSTEIELLDNKLKLPIISSNMDSVTGSSMASAMASYGAIGCLHRFCDIQSNIDEFKAVRGPVMVSVGLGDGEFERAEALFQAGARTFVVDVAHGASMEVVYQAKRLFNLLRYEGRLVVGNFASAKGIHDFIHHAGEGVVDAFKVGVGGGSACTTRVVTGCGLPTFASLLDCSTSGEVLIADGGIRNSGDFAKALAAGAHAVMLGRTLAGADESLAQVDYNQSGSDEHGNPLYLRVYRGSASAESYEVQGKTAAHRTPEGESFLISSTGPVANTLQVFEAGLRSSMAYLGAGNLEEFHRNAEFVVVTGAGTAESKAHGKA